MLNKEQIEQWEKEGVVTHEQAQKMLVDTAQLKSEQSSGRFVTVMSTIGAVLLGLGAILFVAANWLFMTDSMKVLLLLVSTFSSYWAGYYFKYEKQNLPKVGAALIFLGAMLFGASIFLIAQIYNVNANASWLVLLWMLGILPFVYAFLSAPIAALSAILFCVWVMLVVGEDRDFFSFGAASIPLLILVSGTLLFGIGTMHYFSEKLKAIARIYRLAGIKIAMVGLFMLTFEFISGVSYYSSYMEGGNSETSLMFMVFGLFSMVLAVISLVLNPSQAKTNPAESSIALGLALISVMFFGVTPSSSFYLIVFNFIFAGIVAVLLTIGYQREDMSVINTGMFWLVAFLIAKYFDFFFDFLDISIFFIFGGIVLMVGGSLLERKRREIKKKIIIASGVPVPPSLQ